MKKKVFALVAAILALAVLFTACGNGSGSEAPAANSSNTSAGSSSNASSGTAVKEKAVEIVSTA
ncbi:MAG: hypothetical protein ACOX4M_06200 [Acetivibrionales bacterium]